MDAIPTASHAGTGSINRLVGLENAALTAHAQKSRSDEGRENVKGDAQRQLPRSIPAESLDARQMPRD